MNRHIAVLGMGRSGQAVARFLQSQGRSVTVYDRGTDDDPRIASVAQDLQKQGIAVTLGFDGRFAKSQVEQVITSPGVDMRHPALVQAAREGIEVIGEVEFAYRHSKAPIIAITGTNGKSTTTAMTYVILREAGLKPVLCGNIFGSGYHEVPLTEAAIGSSADQVLVAEISSFQLEWVKEFRPRCAAITNITEDHLTRYDSFEQYANVKRRIFSAMGTGDTIVVNPGDPQTYPSNENLRDRGHGHPRVRFYSGAAPDASYDGDHLKISALLPIESLPVLGQFNLQNACLASLLAMSYLESIEWGDGLSRVDICFQGLKAFVPLEHRMEKVGERDGIFVVNNSMCTNPEAVIKSSAALSGVQHLLIGGIKKNYSFAPVKEYLAKHSHLVYLFGRDAAEIAGELGQTDQIFDTMEEAFAEAARKAASGEVIMLAPGCASMDQFTDFVERGNTFKRIAKEWLKT